MSDEEKKVYIRKEKKPSWLERHNFTVDKKARKGAITETKMHEFGVGVLEDRKLGDRMEVLEKFIDGFMKEIQSDDLKVYVANLEDRVELLNYAILQIAGPFARSGSKPRFAVLMRGWYKWYSLAKTGILEVKSWVQVAQQTQKEEDNVTNLTDRSSINIRNDVHYLANFLNITVFPDAFRALNLCFVDEDISPRAAVVIQSMMPQKGVVPQFYEDGLGKSGA